MLWRPREFGRAQPAETGPGNPSSKAIFMMDARVKPAHDEPRTLYWRPVPRIRPSMRVCSVPLSVPFLRTVIAALIDGRLVDGFEARGNPAALADATLYLPTRRAVRVAREVFLDELKADAAVLPRIVPLGDIDEDELRFCRRGRAARRRRTARYPAKARRTRPAAHAGASGRGLGERAGACAAGCRRTFLDALACIRSRAADR